MIFKPSSLHKFFFTYICPRFYGGGSPAPAPSQTTQTVNQNTIPEQLMPYVKNMLNRAEPLSQAAYVPYSTNAADYVAPFSPLQKQAQTSAANLQTPTQFGAGSNLAGAAGIGQLGTAQTAQGYGAQGAGYGRQAANVGAMGGLGYGAQSAGLGMQAAGMAGQGYGAGAQYAQQATDPNAVGAYMNPYLQQSLAPQLKLLNQQYGIKQAQQQGAATQAGAFGGSREALQGGLINQGQALAQQEMIAQGYNQAFGQAQQAQQFGANLGLQGMQAGNQAMQTGLQGLGQGLTGVNTALQGYQQGMAGSQAGLQGLSTAQQGYTGAANAGATLGNLGTAQLGAETNILGTQNTIGGQQQAQQQQAINQAVQNYQNAQNYPYMQLGFMSDLLRGTPVGNTTQTTYMAQPGMASQIGGLATAGLGAYAALKAEGGPIKDKGFKAGGIVGYKTGGEIEESMRSKLEDLDVPHLQSVVQNKESPKMAGIAKEVLATKLAKGGIVAFADEGEVKDKKKRNPLLTPITELQAEAAPVANKTAEPLVGPQYFMPNEEILPSPAASTLGIPISAKTPTITEEGAASPTGIAGVPEAPGIVKPAVTMPPSEYMTQLQKDMSEAETKANRPVEDIIEENKKREEEYAGKDTATADYREKLTQERANSKDEARRLMGLRVMEIGANWASTPGNSVAAGMKALKEGLPGIMEDNKANKKAMRDLDASIYGLEHAARLEDLGRIKEAEAEKDKSQSLFLKHKDTWINVGLKKEELDQQRDIAEKKIASEEKIANARVASYGGKGALTANARINTLTSLADDYITAAGNAETPEDEANYLAQATALRKQAAELAGADPGLGTTIGGDIASQAKAELERRRGAK